MLRAPERKKTNDIGDTQTFVKNLCVAAPCRQTMNPTRIIIAFAPNYYAQLGLSQTTQE